MNHSRKLQTPSLLTTGSTGRDGTPDHVIPQRRPVSEELRQILLAACRAATMDGFLLAAALIPARLDKNGYAVIDRARLGTSFTNLEHEEQLSSLFLLAAQRLKGAEKND